MQPNYYAILPANVRYDKKLKPMEKILYAEITALSNKDGYCSASNSYFAKLYEKSNETISRWISHLEKEGYLKVVIDVKKGNLRKIYPIDKKIKTIDENVNTLLTKKSRPIDENVKHNNINTILQDSILQENNNASLKETKTLKEPLKTIDNLREKIVSLLRERKINLDIRKIQLLERKLYELSKSYSLEEIEEVFKFGLEDSFYCQVVSEPNSFYNKFESIKMKYEKQKERKENYVQLYCV